MALDFSLPRIDGQQVDLGKTYGGKVLLLVNVASKCGLTPQYKQLQSLYDKYRDRGFVILGFPCNQFGRQEPGTEAEIQQFCSENYGVTFDMFSKIEVNGDDACDLYRYLTGLETRPTGSGPISWNFEKFLIGRDGRVVARFSPRTAPDAAELLELLEKELDKAAGG